MRDEDSERNCGSWGQRSAPQIHPPSFFPPPLRPRLVSEGSVLPPPLLPSPPTGGGVTLCHRGAPHSLALAPQLKLTEQEMTRANQSPPAAPQGRREGRRTALLSPPQRSWLLPERSSFLLWTAAVHSALTAADVGVFKLTGSFATVNGGGARRVEVSVTTLPRFAD